MSREDAETLVEGCGYANARGSLSTLDPSREAQFAERFGKYFTGFQHQTVRMRTLNSILGEHQVDAIDFISIDIEGHEVL